MRKPTALAADIPASRADCALDPRKMEALIAEHGHMNLAVFGDDRIPPMSYTIGLTAIGHPEIVIVGFDRHLSQTLLNGAARRRDALHDYAEVDQIANLPLAVRDLPLDVSDATLIQARLFYGRAVKARQLILPDVHGLWPWQPGCDAKYAALQSQLVDYRLESRPN